MIDVETIRKHLVDANDLFMKTAPKVRQQITDELDRADLATAWAHVLIAIKMVDGMSAEDAEAAVDGEDEIMH